MEREVSEMEPKDNRSSDVGFRLHEELKPDERIGHGLKLTAPLLAGTRGGFLAS